MHVVHLYDGHERVAPGEGSVPSNVYQTAKHTAALGHKTMVIERQWEETERRSREDGIEFHRINPRVCSNKSNETIVHELVSSPTGIVRFATDRAIFALQALRVLRDIEYDVVNFHLPFSANILVHLNPSIRDRLVFSYRSSKHRLNLSNNTEPPAQFLSFVSPDLHLMNRAARTVVVNDSLLQELESETGLSDKDLDVVPSGIELSEMTDVTYDDTVVNEYGLRRDTPTILFAGSIVAHKGIIHLCEAAKQLKDNHGWENLQVVLAGRVLEEEYEGRLKEYIKEHNLQDVIRFLGFVPHEKLISLYRFSDAVVLPSLEEGFGKVITEAMALQTPVVATSVGGPAYQITDEWNGLLADPANPEMLAEQINHLLENPDERTRMGVNGRKRVEESFEWGSIAEQYVEIYKEVIKNVH